ncbi:MAG: TonB C-terminal domain-containing protein [Sphingobium sp.]|nr:TonB C-terminal domain-containing protein [Sphingobium sp.]MBP8670746.1 TonB C-terminal domain-containing protein [Sphingobium sp.]MBP9157780.1 TonB C-terminal domain-containing protein [Sphingobium sp.]MCC6482590.1 TonB C-terminal domain-containing protein [Sphingomonadaceae bacterium]
MDRTDKIGLGVAGAGHVLLFAALSAHWLTADPLKLDNEPIEISIADDMALRSAAPKIADAPPPPSGAQEAAAQPDDTPPAPAARDAAPEPLPVPTPTPVTPPRQPAKPATPTAPPKPKGSGLKLDTSDWMKPSAGANPQAKPSDGAPASSIGPAQQSALAAEIRRQIKPFWKAPTGADADLLRTTLSVRLARDGALVGDPQVVSTSGQTASNRGQVRLHQEQAIRAVRLAAPFQLPADLYDGWKSLSVTVDRKLSQ